MYSTVKKLSIFLFIIAIINIVFTCLCLMELAHKDFAEQFIKTCYYVTGSASLIPYEGSFVNGVLNTEKYKYTGTPTGTLTLTTGEKMVPYNNKLVVAHADGCPLCGEDIVLDSMPMALTTPWIITKVVLPKPLK